MDTDSVAVITNSIAESNLAELAMYGICVGDAGATDIAKALTDPKCKLRLLTLSRCGIGKKGGVALGESIKNSRLEQLNLPQNEIKSDGASAIGISLRDSNLKELDLSGNGIKSGGAVEIASRLTDPRCQLRIVNLRDNKLGDTDAFSFALALGSTPFFKSRLEELNLGGNEIGWKGADELVNVITKMDGFKFHIYDNPGVGTELWTRLSTWREIY
jgi:Ran GTPase-activating protein (RanGAP) involved in mRNA processing and transport